MTNRKSAELPNLLDQLESLALEQLQVPDGSQSSMEHDIVLPGDFTLNLAEDIAGGAIYTQSAPRLLKYYLNLRSHLVFSSIIEEREDSESEAHGIFSDFDWTSQLVTPTGQPHLEPLLRTFSALGISIASNPGTTHESKPLFGHSHNDTGDQSYDGAPIPEHIAAPLFLTSRQILGRYGLYSDWRHRTLDAPSVHFYLKSSKQHTKQRSVILPEPSLYIKLVEGEISYVIEKQTDGSFEQKVYHGPETTWYRDLSSYQADYNDDGEIFHYGYEGVELAEKEQTERELGMYEPSVAVIKNAVKKLSLFKATE